MMNCRSKIELNVCQIVFLISLCAIVTFIAVIGWFRNIDPVKYTTSSHVTSGFYPSIQPIPYLDDIGSPPLLNSPHLYVQWTFLQMNDVYELIPLAGGKKGGMARVATIRKLLLQENRNTITIISGDVVSPSALGMKRKYFKKMMSTHRF
jgi:2',3'-cyclic-nucleotide 2'-phosphodiesterase (5'-nucleotidase family)